MVFVVGTTSICFEDFFCQRYDPSKVKTLEEDYETLMNFKMAPATAAIFLFCFDVNGALSCYENGQKL